MNYTKEVSEKVELVNGVLDEIHAPHLLENPDFSVDEMSMESWLKINLNDGGHNKVPLSLTFTQTSLEIRLDRIAEAIDWSDKDLKESRSIVSTMLKNLFTNHVLVEYHGASRTLISLFGQDGKCTNNFKYSEGISFKGKREDRLYHPIY
ncbi:hypothetical protein GCM10007049_35870 [Echinicola pacifica]|uniref:Uncharacterized protein n=1 Tax=Echinicola pacifica TaxID=346377 RepID=A0A918Q9V6_9BACT|nr:hypothetical protein [Echinicola pacifica]GGZ39322.1 hypothetical protein GCM10007049_35870 [Echinicola pacifica]